MDRPADPTWRRWEEIDPLFAAALDLPEAERATFVARSCGADRELRDAVMALITAEAESAGLFDRPDSATAGAALRELAAVVPGEPAPDAIGPYRLLRQVGRGGMGTVYLAERADADFEQRVAVKLLRRGLDTDDIVRRFLAERRILAGLDHPNIAQLLDGGSTEDGRPYLVMQYVDGLPITAYCRRNELPVRQRLEIFLRVADAVRYAHAKLVVHRDIKPSNIMVTAEGRVKLLDFGIAKLLVPGQEEGGHLTRTGLHVLTPEYASPEQRRGDPITTGSDIYQLGMLLYVLLTGGRPAGTRGTREGNQDRPILRPSTAVGQNARLRNALRGDLDTIALKALESDPTRRYESVQHLAADVQAHLGGRPVTARPDTLAYRTGKLLRRHRWIAPGAAAALLFVTVYAVNNVRHTAAIEAQRNAAQAEAERANEVQRLLVDLFRSPDPLNFADPERGTAITVVEALDVGAARVLNDLGGRPQIQASLLDALADVFTSLGAHDRAMPIAERALVLYEQVFGIASPQYRAGLARLAATHLMDGDSALALLRRRLDMTLAVTPPAHAEVAEARVDLAAHLKDHMRRPVDAEAEYVQALATPQPMGAPPTSIAKAHRGLADIYDELGRPTDAEPHARLAVQLHARLDGESSPNTAIARVTLARVLGALGRDAEAEAEFRRAIALLEGTYGPDHGITLNARNNLAVFRRGLGDLAGAERAFRELLRPQIRARGEGSREVGDTYQNLGSVIGEQDRIGEAIEMHVRAAAIYETALDPSNYLLAFPYLSLAGLELRQANFRAAETAARRALGTLEATLPAGHYATAVARCRVGRALVGQGDSARGREILRRAVRSLPLETPVPAYRAECVAALEALAPGR